MRCACLALLLHVAPLSKTAGFTPTHEKLHCTGGRFFSLSATRPRRIDATRLIPQALQNTIERSSRDSNSLINYGRFQRGPNRVVMMAAGVGASNNQDTNSPRKLSLEENEMWRRIAVYDQHARLTAENPNWRDLDIAIVMNFTNTSELVSALRAGKRAHRELVISTLPLVTRVVNRYRSAAKTQGISIEDLIQEGSMGLMKSASDFDPRRGIKFSAYAYLCVRGVVIKFLSENGRGLRVTKSFTQQALRLAKINSALASELGRPPSYEELAMRINDLKIPGMENMTGKKVARIDSIAKNSRSIVEVDTGSESALMNIPETDRSSPERFVSDSDVAAILQRAISCLTDRQAQIMRLRYGIGTSTPDIGSYIGRPGHAPMKTQKEVGRELGVRQETISILEKNAIASLREALRRGTKEGDSIRENVHQLKASNTHEVDLIDQGHMVHWPLSPLKQMKNQKRRENQEPRLLLGEPNQTKQSTVRRNDAQAAGEDNLESEAQWPASPLSVATSQHDHDSAGKNQRKTKFLLGSSISEDRAFVERFKGNTADDDID